MNRIEESFVSYQVKVIPTDASETQVRETERAFYAGAIAMMGILHEVSSGRVPVGHGQVILANVYDELRRYADKVMEGCRHEPC